ETPAGFELNSAAVAGRVQGFMETRLQNYNPRVEVIPARKKGTRFSPDDVQVARRILEQDLLFMGPGSPSYAVRQLADSLAWHLLKARNNQGMPVAFASAAAISIGKLALPVYEIFKVGEDPHWKNGLDLLGYLGLDLVVIPHWNNNDGGEELDTRRCFLGVERFTALAGSLDSGLTILGIDENTGLILDFEQETVQVLGSGSVHILQEGEETAFSKGETFPLRLMGDYRGKDARPDLPQPVWEMIHAAHKAQLAEAAVAEESESALADAVPEQVLDLVEKRRKAREARDWSRADTLREEIQALGWSVVDTVEGPRIEKAANSVLDG
ncbi:MAG: hypothetical protein IH586_04985, partial [Anaerolineaceae bacterium]|nr:hypothetical protein [Anaerolineaceae bacterium]